MLNLPVLPKQQQNNKMGGDSGDLNGGKNQKVTTANTRAHTKKITISLSNSTTSLKREFEFDAN